MKTAFVLNIHSVLDIITNSSSELFIVDDDTTVKTVEEMLKYMVDQWNEMGEKGIFGKWHQNLKYEDIMSVRTFSDEDVVSNHGWEYGYEKKENIGKIIIESESDNSIPSAMMEWIESAFSAKRWHLG